MSKRNRRHIDLRTSVVGGRRRQARRTHALFEALEKRRLLSGYTFTLTPQSSTTANGTYLKNLIDGATTITGDGVTNHTVTLGDTLILPDTTVYDMGVQPLNLPDLGAAATVTETGGVIQNTATMTFKGVPGTYSGTPTVVFMDTTGSGAAATPVMGTGTAAGEVVGLNITNGGANYSTNVTVAIEGGTGTLTIESAGYSNGDFSGRVNPSNSTQESDFAQIIGSDPDGIIQTVLSDSDSHSGAAHDYAFDGIEIAPNNATAAFSDAFVLLGVDASVQNNVGLVPYNFTFDQCYIHGWDDMNVTSSSSWQVANNYGSVTANADLNTNYKDGIGFETANTTVENSYISDIHNNNADSHAIGGVNGTGNYLITNNFLEATTENILFGGSNSFLTDVNPTNITITNNFLFKRLVWNQNSPEYGGVHMDVKNILELKTGVNVTIADNLLENCWVGADQRGEAFAINSLDQYGNTPWDNVADITITDNVIENVGRVIQMDGGAGTTNNIDKNDSGPTEIAHDLVFSNNLAFNIGGPEWGTQGEEEAIEITGYNAPINNITITNNTILGTDGILGIEGPNTLNGSNGAVVANFVCENNVFDESINGLTSPYGTDGGCLNSTKGKFFQALTITNAGSGYTAAPTVTITGGGGSGATAEAYIWPATVAGGYAEPLAGQIMYIQILNGGTGYTSAPTVSFNNTGTGGSGAAASALPPPVSGGSIFSYEFIDNLIIGGSSSNYTNVGTNYFPSTIDSAEFSDIPGDEYGILPGSTYSTDGTGGSLPGVNMSALIGNVGGSTPWQPADVNNSLQDYYMFDKGTGTTSVDNGLGGTLTKTATLSSSTLWTTAGESNDGIALTGSTSGSVSVPSFTADSSFTFAAWVNPANFNALQYIASTKNSSSVSAFSLSINTSGQLVAAGTTGSIPGSASTAIPAGQWSLVSVTYSSGTLTLYVNGAEVGSATSVTTTTGTTTLYIGGDQGSVSSFNGTIDEVRYYSSSLAQTTGVAGDANQGLAGGSGYNSGTNGFAVTFSGGGGSGAAATAYAPNSAGEITSIIMTNPGSGYTVAPTMSFTNGGGVGALDTAVMSLTPISYLYQQYGPQIENTYGPESTLTGKTTTLHTDAISHEEANSYVTQTWYLTTYPTGVSAPEWTTATGMTNAASYPYAGDDPEVTFNAAGQYLFTVVVSNSLHQSAAVSLALDVYPVATSTVESGGTVLTGTNTVAVIPSSTNLAPLGQFTFKVATANDVNGTSIAGLGNTILDQFGNTMSSATWSWGISSDNDSNYGTITSGGGVYTAPNAKNLPDDLGNVVLLSYTTPDGVSYNQSHASVNVLDANTPNAPATISVAPSGTNNVISWTAPIGSGETGYHVWLSTDDAYDGTQVDSASTSTLSYTDSSETPGSTYYYYVTAFNANGDGAPTQIDGIVDGAPAAPTNLAATGSVNSVGLTWTNSATGATGVSVWRSTNDTAFSNTSYTEVATGLAGNATSWTDNAANDTSYPPANGTTYYYAVETYNSNYSSLASNISNGATPFGAPTGLTASAIASSQISVSWIDPSNGQASFYLRYENANGGSWTTSTIAAGNTSYLLTTGLSADQQYNFEIEAYTTAGNSGYSSAVGARTWNTTATPTVYEGFNYPVNSKINSTAGWNGGVGWNGAWEATSGTAQVINEGSLVPSNSNVSGLLLTTGNDVQAQDLQDSQMTRVLANSFGGSTAGGTYWGSFLVQSQNSATNSGTVALLNGTNNVGTFGFVANENNDFSMVFPSDVKESTGYGGSQGTNTNLVVFEIIFGTDTTYKMWVNPNQALTSYSGYATGSTNASLGAVTQVQMTLDGNASASETWDEVRIGNSYSSVVPLAVPNAPTGLSPTPVGNSIALNWTASNSPSSLVQGYDVWRSTNGGVSYGSTPYATVGSSTLNYTDSSISGGTVYYYEVTAENTTGDSLNSNIVSASTTPAPPTNLVATPGTSSIALTWTDPGNTSNITGYHVWRSTDNATWGSAYATVTGATASSYTDTAPVAGTTYYYKVTSYNSGGDSTTAAGMTCGVATVTAYEGFNYPTASSWTGANTTGIGFTGNWTVGTSTNAAIVSGLTYTSGSSALTTSGNAVKFIGSNHAIETLSQSVGATGTTLWVGFEFNGYTSPTGQTTYPELTLGAYNGNNFLALGVPYNTKINAEALISGTHYYITGSTSMAMNTTYFVAYEITFSTSGDIVNMYVDPTPGTTAPATASGSMTLPSSAPIPTTNILDLETQGADSFTTFDEVRLGASYGAVAPDPRVIASSNKSGASTRRHPFLADVATPNVSKATGSTKPSVARPNLFYSPLNGGTWQWTNAANEADSLLLGTISKQGMFN